MIKNVLLDGVSITNEHTFLSRVRDSASAVSDVQQYSRGGRSGVTLGSPFYKGFVISMEFTIIGRTTEQLLQQRDRLARFFRIRPDKTVSQTKRLGFQMIDGSVRTVPAIFSPYVGLIDPQDTTKTTISVTAQTELEYYESAQEFEQIIEVVDFGGFAVPFDVPFNMANIDEDPYQDEGGQSVINNLGNSEFYPIIEINAPLNIITLINDTTGKSISYDGELTGEQTLVLDMYNRTAVIDGITNALADITGEWWWLDPGTNAIRLVAGGGTGNAKIKYKYAYRGV